MLTLGDAVDKCTGLSGDGKDIAITLAFCLFLVTMTMGLRFYTLIMRRQSFQASDYLALLSLILYYSSAVTVFLASTIGHIGYRTSETPAWRLSIAFKCIYYIRLAYLIGLGLVKCSLLQALQKTFITPLSHFRFAVWTTMVICACWSLSGFLLAFLACHPFKYNWTPNLGEGHCVNQSHVLLGLGIIDSVTSFVIMVLPLPYLLRTNPTRSQKLATAGVYGIGVFAVAIAILLTVALSKTDLSNFNEAGKMVVVWFTVEWTAAIIVANACVLAPVFACLGLCQSLRSGANPSLSHPKDSSYLLGSMRTLTTGGSSAPLKPKATLAETGSIQSSRSMMRGLGFCWTEATGQAQQPGSVFALEPGEVRVQTGWSVERSPAKTETTATTTTIGI
ncbi:hypothetical protein ASPACDRAFT_80688 [Aspergillus aculeatus ATCC 16872]|uniref:Rhodopsin domain-containing protein n=1 Tax=Aspergillus aculeatus (strain ATCC 16872 / CBS 172.66 / WB 5094) TaxID=690307 RepID=A0A1L9WM27_ASPA1|nr:uncharacterized protein ASPACDRAFT_80688 [Aspergillus aculeatus ATCC 16872]OJJ97204.1 hypothetical protein ASPACDRAFT_80688 [Aspergillus aculeatus ATCC 16872]